MNFAYHFRVITNNSGQFVKYLTIEQDLAALRGQMTYRARNLGMKELDLIVGSWAVRYVPELDKEQLLEFNKQVLQQETPELIRKLLGYQSIDSSENWVQNIRNFAVNDKYSKLDNWSWQYYCCVWLFYLLNVYSKYSLTQIIQESQPESSAQSPTYRPQRWQPYSNLVPRVSLENRAVISIGPWTWQHSLLLSQQSRFIMFEANPAVNSTS